MKLSVSMQLPCCPKPVAYPSPDICRPNLGTSCGSHLGKRLVGVQPPPGPKRALLPVWPRYPNEASEHAPQPSVPSQYTHTLHCAKHTDTGKSFI